MKIPNIASDKLNELVFENRNKSYGAYQLRTHYQENLIKSFLLALFSISCFSFLFYSFNRKTADNFPVKFTKSTDQIIIDVDLHRLIAEKPKPLTKVEHQNKSATTAPSSEIKPIVTNQIEPIIEPIVEPTGTSTATSAVTGSTGTASTVDLPTSLGSNNATTKPTFELSELDIEPEFPGGIDNLMKFLAQHIVYPSQAKELGIQGTVYASFQVNKNGEVCQVKIIRGLEREMNEEVIRVISLFPKWKPGIYKGEAVGVQFRIPVRFELHN